MLVHLKTQRQISDHWPPLRELIRENFAEDVVKCPSYTNNLLTHALLHPENFQLCLHFFEDNYEVPASFFIFDMNYDSLIDKQVCTIPLWLAIRTMSKGEIQILAKELVEWIKGCDCEIIRAQGYNQQMMQGEIAIMNKLGLVKEYKHTYGWYAYI